MLVTEFARRINRSVDTVKRWEESNLLVCPRDERGRRIFTEEHIAVGSRLATLSLVAQRRSEKLESLALREPVQLSLLEGAGANAKQSVTADA
jgi:hypothetical protein